MKQLCQNFVFFALILGPNITNLHNFEHQLNFFKKSKLVELLLSRPACHQIFNQEKLIKKFRKKLSIDFGPKNEPFTLFLA